MCRPPARTTLTPSISLRFSLQFHSTSTASAWSRGHSTASLRLHHARSLREQGHPSHWKLHRGVPRTLPSLCLAIPTPGCVALRSRTSGDSQLREESLNFPTWNPSSLYLFAPVHNLCHSISPLSHESRASLLPLALPHSFLCFVGSWLGGSHPP